MAVNSVSTTLKSQTNAHILRGRPTLKDVERFRNGSVRELRERVTHFTSEFIERVTHFTSEFIERVTHFTSEFIVKLIVNFIENYTLSYELSNYSNHENLTAESSDSNQRSEECRNLLPVYKPRESHTACTATFPGVASVTMIVSLLVLLFLGFVPIIQFNNICIAGFILLCGICIFMAYRSLDVHVQMYITSLLNDCDILDKTNNLTLHVYDDALVKINITKNTRSRYCQYVYYNYRHVNTATRQKRHREPSRLPTRALKRVATKSRKFRRFVFAKILPSVPKSSKLHNYIISTVAGHSNTVIKRKVTSHIKRVQTFNKASRYISLFSSYKVISLYKTQTHLANHCQSKLSNDIEKNPGPTNSTLYIDPSKNNNCTI